MTKMLQSSESVTHSFVIRLWQESSGHWRGVIRHAQSDAQRGVTKLDETLRFIQERINVTPAPQTTTPAERPARQFQWLPRRQMQMAIATFSIVIVAVIVILISNPAVPGALPGAAVGNPADANTWLIFLAGVAVGAGGWAGWSWLSKRLAR